MSHIEVLGDDTCFIPNLPYELGHLPQMFLNDKKEVVICGGSSKICLKLVNGEWISYAKLLEIRHNGHVAVSMADRTFMFGGYYDINTSEVLEHGSEIWKKGPTIPGTGIYSGCGIAISKDELLLIGGNSSPERIIKYNTISNTWNDETSFKIYRTYHMCAYFKNQIFITGGCCWQIGKTVDILTPNSMTLVKGNELNIGRWGHGIGLIHNQGRLTLAVFGGVGHDGDNLDSVEIYDEVTKTWKLSNTLKLSEKKAFFGFLSVPSHLICP